MYFCMPPKFSVPFSTTYTQHTDFIFCTNLAPSPKSLNTKIENFSYISSPSGAPYKVFELLLNTHIQTDVQTQMNTFLHPAPDPEHHPTPKTVQWWLEVTLNEIQYMVPSCMRGLPPSRWYLSKHFVHISGEGPTHLKGTVKGQNMVYRQTYMGKIYIITGKTAY